ncbi:hypothetical protein A3D78_06530 [Candidatus Gottesmanbacteria bacterium RIFCSPHIGHO2_02_FULL_39_14]|uniref:ATP-grasp domain-containing protein n=1 Tax=Candidatus Gottesmanbacteria bacterium RIFCSPHIGHO2_02_FULL_39_14 TaxID=1798383 RepID=A0A1F5ZXZ3_9BACT|nr:MAG: hypothetical protein A3D78_06530 [Candidatus Gottesmanbacteria bacterium RIFCSPHIGHO2_02_FULL_39_14]
MKNKTIVILTNSTDSHAHILVPQIQKLNGQVYRIDTDRLQTHFQITFNPEKGIFSLETPVGKVESGNIFSMWVRRPYDFAFNVRDAKSKFVRQELMAVIRSISLYLPSETLIVDNPEAVKFASYKIPQLKIANQLKIRIPDTVITNIPQTANQFIKKYKKNVIIKPLAIGTAEYNNQAFSIFTETIDKIIDLDLVKNCPTLFQENIRKKSELRITIIGKKIFTVEFDVQKIPEAKIDWRRAGEKITTIPHKVVTLPDKLEKKLLALKNYYGLKFAAIDMARTQDDGYVFFELNPAGQFLWLEEVTGLPLAREMAKFLLGMK